MSLTLQNWKLTPIEQEQADANAESMSYGQFNHWLKTQMMNDLFVEWDEFADWVETVRTEEAKRVEDGNVDE